MSGLKKRKIPSDLDVGYPMTTTRRRNPVRLCFLLASPAPSRGRPRSAPSPARTGSASARPRVPARLPLLCPAASSSFCQGRVAHALQAASHLASGLHSRCDIAESSAASLPLHYDEPPPSCYNGRAIACINCSRRSAEAMTPCESVARSLPCIHRPFQLFPEPPALFRRTSLSQP